MKREFDLPPDEVDLWLAETNEQLHLLEEGLIQLEKEQHDAALLQTIFRAAHTLKGNAGMINHPRMTELTHALESVLDGLRKDTLPITAEVVDTCLTTLDALKTLQAEVVTDQEPPDIAPLVKQLAALIATPTPPLAAAPSPQQTLTICADIAAACFTPAGRAFQLVQAMQTLGAVEALEPPLAVIEKGAPLRRLTAHLLTNQSVAQVKEVLGSIADIARLVVGNEELMLPEAPARPVLAEEHSEDHHMGPLAEKTVRTSVERLDNLMNLLGELVTDRNRLNQQRHQLLRAHHNDPQVADLSQTVLHLGRLTDQLQEEVMRLRMLPIAQVLGKFPRLIRNLARKAGKQAELVLRGEETELDRSVLEVIGDPLLHLLRNAVDHGLELPAERLAMGKAERGVIFLTARHEEGRIILTVEDDGRGIDVAQVKASAVKRGLLSQAEADGLSPEAALELIYWPGLSTAEVATDVSGRGVGMDIVRTNLERLSGQITVETWPGRGTRFQISLPLTLAILPTLLVQVEHQPPTAISTGLQTSTLAIPLSAVMEILRLSADQMQTVRGQRVTSLRGRVLPLLSLNTAFGFAPSPTAQVYVVAVRWGKLEMGLLVDNLLGEQELVIKPLGALFGETPGVSGAAILGDGQVALVLDLPSLFKHANV